MPALIYRCGEINDYGLTDPDFDATNVTPTAEIRDVNANVLASPTVTVVAANPLDITINLPVDTDRDRALERARDPQLRIIMQESPSRPFTYLEIDLQVRP
jgi:hypothetical protein